MAFLLVYKQATAQNITPATGGTNISADNVNGVFTPLTDITIDETSAGQISQGELIFNLPEGFEWDVSLTPSITIEAATGFNGKGTSLAIEFTSITATQVTFTVNSASDQPPNKAGKVTFSGFAVRPTTAELPNRGSIMATGSSVSNVNDSFGELRMVAGAPTDIFIETKTDGSGEEVTARELTAGNSMTVYAIARDQGGNFIANVAADSWSLTNKNGLTANPLSVAADSKSATFSSTLTGSAVITATSGSLIAHPSGSITVTPESPAFLEIITQPSASNTAGIAFPVQPVLEIKDQYGNTVTTDNLTSVTASRSEGLGTLKSNTSTTKAANNGIVTFTGLKHTVANDISISFSADGLPTVTSDIISIDHAIANDLIFSTSPPNGARNTPLEPAPEVQIIDAFGNKVDTAGVAIDLNIFSTTANQPGISGNAVLSNSSGIAVFPALAFNKNGAYTLKAGSANLDSSDVSEEFFINDAGQLANFVIESIDDTVTAGQPFNLKITAVDGQGNVLNGNQGRALFNDKVFIRSSGNLLAGADSTVADFTSGILPTHAVNISTAGEITISATGPANTITGTSDPITVLPAAAHADSSFFMVSEDSLTANGSSQSVITVTLVDQYGNKLISGGDNVAISAAGPGALSATQDNGDGTYSGILTAPTDVGSTIITATLNGNALTNASRTAQQIEVGYFPGPLATFIIEDAAGNSGIVSGQTAGVSFNIKITAKDADNNTVTSFSDAVEISSNATFESGSGSTASFTNGVLASHSVTLTSAGDFKLTARRLGLSKTGQSNLFTVSPASADNITSTMSVDNPFLENDGVDNTTVSIQLKDEFGNNLTGQDGNSVNLFFEGAANATLSNGGNAVYTGNGVFTTTLTAGTAIETINVIASLNNPTGSNAASDIDTVQVIITEINTWRSQSGGNRTGQRDWNIAENWSLASTPAVNQVTLIPTTPLNNSAYPVINQSTTIDFLEIQDDATVNLEPGFTMTFNYNLSGEGTYICDRSTVIIYGDLTIATYASTTCNTTFTGSGETKITGNALLGTVTIDKDITLTGSLLALDSLIVTEGSTLTVEDGATIDIQGETQIDGEINFNGGHLTISHDVDNDFNIDISNTTVEFNGTEPQDITGLGDFSDLIINNPEGVTFHNDVIVNDTLFLNDGMLTIDSGYSLVSTEKSGNLSNIRMLRAISGEPGWRMIAPPLVSTYADLLDSTVTQGYLNSQLGFQDSNGDSLQPNVMFYDETYPGTDNQRWRAPGDAADQLTPGRGLFVYYFGDVAGDNRYNNPLPDTLTIQGPENDGDGTSFTFPVTYTATADTGWNLVGNPFAATIDWDDGNWTKENMDNVIYIWDPVKNDYQEYNGIDGDPGLDDGLIMPFQAFWVKANGNGPPLLKVNKASKTTGGTFYRKSNKRPASIEFLLTADSLEKTSHVTLSLDGKTGKDRRDAYRLLPFGTNTYLELYFTLNDGTALSIDNLARSFGKVISIPIHVGGFKNGQPLNGTYTLSWPEFGDVPDAWKLILEDQKTGKKINLRKTTFYSFDVSQSKQKGLGVMNTLENFQLVRPPASKSKARYDEKPRFLLRIDPGADAAGLPTEYSLGVNYPNPFTETTTIPFDTPLEGKVQIFIYDILGRRVKTIINEHWPAGYHDIPWNPSHLASGVYICVMRAGGKQFTQKMTYIK